MRKVQPAAKYQVGPERNASCITTTSISEAIQRSELEHTQTTDTLGVLFEYQLSQACISMNWFDNGMGFTCTR